MPYQIMPLLQRMEQFYQLPRDRQRFETYLEMMLDKDRKDIELPIASFNPMGKELVLAKINELRVARAEIVLEEEVANFNARHTQAFARNISVAINLVDDVGGAWSSRYSTDYTSKFVSSATLKRNFCLPFFFTSETFDEASVRLRIREYLYRTYYGLQNPPPTTLAEHLAQEVYVQQMVEAPPISSDKEAFALMETRAKEFAQSTDYNLIFNFFYGDPACEVLNYKTYGLPHNAGFKYAALLAQKNGAEATNARASHHRQ